MKTTKVLIAAFIACCGVGMTSCSTESKKTESVMTQEKKNVSEEVYKC